MSTEARKPRSQHDDQRILSGKRRAPRRRRSVAVECVGPAGRSYAGRTIDISRGGMLLEITDQEFQQTGDSQDLIPFAARVAMQFPQGMDVTFGDGALRVHAKVVRIASRPGKPPIMLLGCQFEPELSDLDCRLLGVDAGLDETAQPVGALNDEAALASNGAPAARPAEAPPVPSETEPLLHADAAPAEEPAAAPAAEGAVAPSVDDRDVSAWSRARAPSPGSRQPSPSTWAPEGAVLVHLFPTNAPLHGPRFVGRLDDVRVRTAVVELPAPADEGDPASWAAALGASLRAVCIRDGRVLWETRARVTHVGASETPGWARATLLAFRAPPPHLRRLLGFVATNA